MKSYFVALLALPAALAAPANEKHEVTACACANAKGETFVPSICLYYAGAYITVDGKDYCFPAATWSERMDEAFAPEGCARVYPDWPLSACVKSQACPTIGDYQKPC